MTKSIPLTQGKVALVDDEDYEEINKVKWCYQNTGYAYRRNPLWFGGQKVLWMHRVVMGAPDGIQVDHINRNGLDNRKENLRLATRAQNSRNTPARKNGTSGFKGVTRNKRDSNWIAQITVDGKNFHIGNYDSITDAAHAYDEAARKYFGEFAYVNFQKGE